MERCQDENVKKYLVFLEVDLNESQLTSSGHGSFGERKITNEIDLVVCILILHDFTNEMGQSRREKLNGPHQFLGRRQQCFCTAFACIDSMVFCRSQKGVQSSCHGRKENIWMLYSGFTTCHPSEKT